jgi:ribonuclease E
VIKGILPETPAPMAVPKPEPVAVPAPVVASPPVVVAAPAAAPAGGGFFAWVKRLFGGDAEPVTATRPAAKATAVATATAGADKPEGRGDRGARGGRGGRDGKRGGRDEQGDGRGRRNERGERSERGERADRPKADEAARPEAAEGAQERKRPEGRGDRGEGRSEGRGEGRPEGRGPGRSEGGGGEGRGDRGRGPRPEREPRRTSPLPEAAVDDAASPLAFVDTVPGGPAAEAGEGAPGEPSSSRRRRRGGRGGRDRDEAREGGLNGQGPVQGSEATESAELETRADPEGHGAVPGLVGEADAPPTEAGERGEGRRRGRGRDRNRRDRTDETGPQAGMGQSDLGEPPAQDNLPAVPFVSAVAEPVLPLNSDDTADVTPPAAAPSRPAPVEAVVPVAPAWVQPTPVARVAEPVAAVAPSIAAKVEPFVLPITSLQAVVEASGLQWVGSDAEKIRTVSEAMANEPKPVHVPRERKAVAPPDEGPLVLVETRKDLSQFKLPFETAAPQSTPGQ